MLRIRQEKIKVESDLNSLREKSKSDISALERQKADSERALEELIAKMRDQVKAAQDNETRWRSKATQLEHSKHNDELEIERLSKCFSEEISRREKAESKIEAAIEINNQLTRLVSVGGQATSDRQLLRTATEREHGRPRAREHGRYTGSTQSRDQSGAYR